MKKNIILFFFIMFVYFFNNILVDAAFEKSESTSVEIWYDDGIISYFDTLEQAISSITDDKIYTIKFLKDIEITKKIEIGNKNIIRNIIIDGNGYNLLRGKVSGNYYLGNFITIYSNSSLTLNNIKYDGGNNWSFDLDKYNKTLELQDGTAVYSNFITPESDKPVVTDFLFINNGNLFITNSEFKNQYSLSKGYVNGMSYSVTKIINSNFTHSASAKSSGLICNVISTNAECFLEGDSLISNNFVGGNGGVFHIRGNSKVYMNSGTISYNRGVNVNGVIAMMYAVQSSFIMNGGTISNNYGLRGSANGRNGMIYVHNGGKFVMNGGIIENNISNSTGAVDVAGYASSDIELNSGIIQNNKALSNDKKNDVYIGSDYDLVIGNNMVINGNIYVYGDILNNGKINGDVTLNIVGTEITNPIDGSGNIKGDVVVYHDTDKEIILNNDIVEGNYVPCENDKQILVKFYYNGGIDNNGLVDHGLASYNTNEIVTPIVVNKEGHSVEWYLDKDLTKKYEPSILSNKTDLYAKWIPNKYNVSWNINGKITTKTMTYGEIIKMPKKPSINGYKFVGWDNYTKNMTVPDYDITFIAKFEIKVPETNDTVLTHLFLTICSFIVILFSSKLFLITFNKKEA